VTLLDKNPVESISLLLEAKQLYQKVNITSHIMHQLGMTEYMLFKCGKGDITVATSHLQKALTFHNILPHVLAKIHFNLAVFYVDTLKLKRYKL
jgi:hypothetical protein